MERKKKGTKGKEWQGGREGGRMDGDPALDNLEFHEKRLTPEANPPGYNDWAYCLSSQLLVLAGLWQTCLNKANA